MAEKVNCDALVKAIQKMLHTQIYHSVAIQVIAAYYLELEAFPTSE